MRLRITLAVAAVGLGGLMALPATASTVPSVLACADLPGTFQFKHVTVGDPFPIDRGQLTVRGAGSCTVNGQSVQVTLYGTGLTSYGGICGEIVTVGDFGNGVYVQPIDVGRLNVTLWVTPPGSPVQKMQEIWETENTGEAVMAFRVFNGPPLKKNVGRPGLARLPALSKCNWSKAHYSWVQTL
jgi:hypothetical protein